MRRINDAGLKILKDFEELRLEAYDDGGGVWTIGWGHTGSDVFKGLVISAARADELLLEDLQEAKDAVERGVKISISDNQFSALVVFVYNIGCGNFASSTLLRKLNAGRDPIEVSKEFGRWNMDNGKVLAGLIRRREAEKQLFLTP